MGQFHGIIYTWAELDVIKDPHWSIPQGECHVGHEKTPRSGFLYSGYSQKKHRGHITDCHVGNPCVHKYDPTNIIRDPIIEGIQGVRLEGAWEALKGLEGFPFVIVNTKEYHSECSGNINNDIAWTLITACEPDDVQQVFEMEWCLTTMLIDLLALDSISHILVLVLGGWSSLPPYSISQHSRKRCHRYRCISVTNETSFF
ncbi:hypothetical protein Tco_0194484 [Tanacetum coccineum]